MIVCTCFGIKRHQFLSCLQISTCATSYRHCKIIIIIIVIVIVIKIIIIIVTLTIIVIVIIIIIISINYCNISTK